MTPTTRRFLGIWNTGVFLLLTASTAQASGIPALVDISRARGNPNALDEWPEHNDPIIFNQKYEYNYEKLKAKMEAKLSDAALPWSDSYWPSRSGGIANRWQLGPEYPYHQFGTYKEERAKVLRMSPEDLRLLSPAEKYDISQGDYTYSLTRAVLQNTDPGAPFWWGICEGWTAAAMSHREPDVNVVVNPDGIPVEFGSSDVKGLLALLYAWDGMGKSIQLGWRCDKDSQTNETYGDCNDVHPASFHLVLVNRIGFMNQSIAADVDGDIYNDPYYPERGPRSPREYQFEVWNQPFFAFKTRELETYDCSWGCDWVAPDTVRMVRMETIVTWAGDENPLWHPTAGTEDYFQGSKRYEYWLEIDHRNHIVGGSWVSEARPDFLWIIEPSPFAGKFAGLNAIYKPAEARPYCVPQRYVDESDYRPVYPTSPVCPASEPRPEPEPGEPDPEYPDWPEPDWPEDPYWPEEPAPEPTLGALFQPRFLFVNRLDGSQN